MPTGDLAYNIFRKYWLLNQGRSHKEFYSLKISGRISKHKKDEEKKEEAQNPMKLLEKSMKQSKQELELLESLEELTDLNQWQHIINYDNMSAQFDTIATRFRTEKEREEYNEKLVRDI